jgi:hypothetical protein
MKTLKHIGRIKSTGEKVLVAFRTIPGDSSFALVVTVGSLTAPQHDAIINLVETDQAQEAFEFGEVLAIRHFPEGGLMLPVLSQLGKLQKIGTSDILITPTSDEGKTIPLSDLNTIIAEQKNCAVDDLCNFVSGAPSTEVRTAAKVNEVPKTEEPAKAESAVLKAANNEVLDDKSIARSYRSQADAMYKEAARLRKEADSLDPPQKKTTSKVKETEGA